MFLRTNRLLKLVAILLFVFELVVPLYVASLSTEASAVETDQICSKSFHQTWFSPLLLEELSENEEEKDSHKSSCARNDFSTAEFQSLSYDIHRVNFSSYINAYQQSSQTPALFQVHCKLVI
jgi:hypothetical protein